MTTEDKKPGLQAPVLAEPDVYYPSPDPDLNPNAPDVPKKTLKTLAQWASDLTTAQQDNSPPGTPSTNLDVNAYKVDPPNGDVVTSPMGAPAPGAYVPGMDSTFGSNNVPGLEKGSRRLVGDGNRSVTRSGHEYLGKAQVGLPKDVGSNIREASLDPQIEQYVTEGSLGPDGSKGIFRNNRWSLGSVHQATDPVMVYKSSGQYDPAPGVEVSSKQLANVGITLTARASTEMRSSNANYDVGKWGPPTAAILPGWAQMAVTPVDLSKLDVLDVLFDNAGVTSGPAEVSILAPGSISSTKGSYGQMNNPLDEYTGMSAFGMAALSVSLCVATSAILMAFSMVLKLIMKSNNGSNKSPQLITEDGRHYMGVYGGPRPKGSSGGFPPLPMDANFVANLIGVRQGSYNWSTSVEAGLLRFYGSSKTSFSSVFSSFGGGDVAGMLSRAVESPGYYSVVNRSIIRSGVTIVDSLKGIFKSPNVFSTVKNLVSFFDVLKSSKFMAALNVFAMIGESVLSHDSDTETGVDRSSAMDAKPNDVASNTKNRLKDSWDQQTTKLAWSANRAISMLATPNILRGTLLQGIADSGPAALVTPSRDPLSRTVYPRNDGRLPTSAVTYLESVLDSEYVPFYFHDIRTNEIISFHAFLASLTDDYAANWESSDALGRVESIKIYKSTSRKIGLSFHVVATSQADFDEMWVKINKLTTLVYPQYTMGRVVSDGTTDVQNRFVVPFTQLVSASPLVRIRLGDLYRSNYSRFALARLFGMGSQYNSDADATEKLMIGGEKNSFLTGDVKDGTDKLVEKLNKKIGFEKDLSDVVYLLDTSQLTPQNLMADGDSPEKIRKAVTVLMELQALGSPVAVKIDGVSPLKGTLQVRPTMTRAYNYLSGDAAGWNYQLNLSVDMIVGLSPHALTAPPKEVALFVEGKSGSGTDTYSNFKEFMNGNALTKAFESSGGKGLAGVIESMGFDWYDKVTWEIDPGSKAPKLCKVTVSFSPIHDISPGIDHNGYNRAPIYPVGSSGGGSYGSSQIKTPSREDITNALDGHKPGVTDSFDRTKK